MIQRETYSQPDGAVWNLYTLDEGYLVVTGRGRELIGKKPETLHDIANYRRAVLGQALGKKVANQSVLPDCRQHLGSGGNSDVYTLNEDIVVKEGTNAQSLNFALERMDTFHNVMERGHVPRWIDMPAHYGLLVGPQLDRQYMMMQKIDTGTTVEHVLSNGGTNELQREAVQEVFGDLTPADRSEICQRFKASGTILRSALEAEGHNSEQYMPDWHEGNVLLERLEVPIGSSPYRFWVIDQ